VVVWFLFLGLLFPCSPCLLLCQFHAVLLPWLCNIVWSWVLWYPQHCSFCSGLLLLFGIFYTSIWILRLIFLFLWWMTSVFLMGIALKL
jgi:hypothetical protein